MELVTPGFGLIFWTSLTFLLVVVILRSVAWKPILSSLEEREKSIHDALSSAEKAKQEMASLQASNEKLLQEARLERDKILRDAKAVADKTIADAKTKAEAEANRIVSSAQEAIQNEKQAALTEVKNQVANLSLTIAEKILKQELSNRTAQEQLAKTFLNELKVN